MFSRYKKTGLPARTGGVPSPAAPDKQPAESVGAGAEAPAKPRVQRRPAGSHPGATPAQPAPVDKEKRRKERLAEVKMELHKALLDNLNLSALDSASEKEL